MRTFRDRDDAGAQLADRLMQCGFSQPVVLGMPRGGVVLAAHVARRLHGDLGVVVARKLRAPHQAELAIGAITAGGISWINTELAAEAGADANYIKKEQALQVAEAFRREKAFDGRHRPPVVGRVVIIVDDGVATGSTALAAIRAIEAEGASRVVLAVPVGPPDTLSVLSREADEVVVLLEPAHLGSVGQFYDEFDPVLDDGVRYALDEFDRDAAARNPTGVEGGGAGDPGPGAA